MSVSRRTVVVAGLPVHVYTKRDLGHLKGDVAALFLLHGRLETALDYDKRMGTIVNLVYEKGHPKRELAVITFDQRNHGERLVDRLTNHAWKEGNDRHAIDMYAMYVGTTRDVSYLIDFLPAYLFPSGEANIVEWSIGGISLGGHATWFALCHEPRLTVGIPIIGCPDYLHLMSRRAKKSGIPFEPPYIPQSFLSFVERNDPARFPYTASDASNPFLGKKVLVLSGADDQVVPWESSEEFVKNLNVGQEGVKKEIVYPGVGHEFTSTMLTEAAQFLWDHVVNVP